MKIRNRLITIGSIATAVPLIVVAGIALWQAQSAEELATHEVKSLTTEVNERILGGVVAMVTTQQEVLEKKVLDDLAVARSIMRQHGSVDFSDDAVIWDARNQFSGRATRVELPRMMIGDSAINQNFDPDTPTPIVDEVRSLVGGTATIFQRMNAAGDMLRIATNVLTNEGRRAIGTFIPAIGPDGSRNAVVSTVLAGETFVGRAFVVNAWYITAYEPIVGSEGDVIGVLYTGVPEQSAQSLRRQIIETRVGESGYAFVLDSSGAYVISQNGARDGEVIIEERDAEGRAFIREMIDRALRLGPGEYGTISYPWKNAGDAEARTKTVSFAYFEPWDWIIGAGTFDDEFMEGINTLRASNAQGRLVMIGVFVLALVLSVVVWLIISGRISGPIVRSVGFARKIARGELDAELDIRQSDEIGTLADSLRQMLGSLRSKADSLSSVAHGDLTVDVSLASEADELGISLRTMVDALNETLQQVREAADQVASGADQIAASSQSLSQGATESASSVEEISSSITEINGQVDRTTESVDEATTLSMKAADDARAGRDQMAQLREAMDEIASSSDAIGKVVKVIDDIAFQINLLALNANVEAARAGKYGKGFAVVAEEVRNLAARSAQAVRETTAIVEQSIGSIRQGTERSRTTGEQLDAIVTGAERVAHVLEEVRSATREQSAGIRQITAGLEQVDQVTQSTTAEAEESAAASEELSGQAEQLRQAVARFSLRRQSTLAASRGRQGAMTDAAAADGLELLAADS